MEIHKMNRSLFRIPVLLAVTILGISVFGFAQRPAATAIYGGQGGNPFADMELPEEARILEVNVFSGDWVDAVQLTYILPDGRTLSSPRYGGPGGERHVFRLDSDEYITRISGRYGRFIDSLSIQTNKRRSPVFGGRGGDRDFSLELPSGNYAVGFIGRAGDYLDAIGLTYLPLEFRDSQQTTIAGGGGGIPFSDRDIPEGARVSAIRVRSGKFIDSVQMIYTLRDGRTFEGPVHGGSGGRANVFQLDSDEYITGISGRYGNYIDSLVFHTSKRTSPAFGGSGGNRDFRISVPSGNLAIGFVGRSAEYLDAVGLKYTPTTTREQNRPWWRRLRR
jgi:hypothetical protein